MSGEPDEAPLPTVQEGAISKGLGVFASAVRSLKVARQQVLEEMGKKEKPYMALEDVTQTRLQEIDAYWATLEECIEAGIEALDESESMRSFGDILCEVAVKERDEELHERLLLTGNMMRSLSKCDSPIEKALAPMLSGVQIFRKQVIPDLKISVGIARSDRRAVDAAQSDLDSLRAKKEPSQEKIEAATLVLEKEKVESAQALEVIKMKLEFLEYKRIGILEESIVALESALKLLYDQGAAIKEFEVLRTVDV